MQNEYFDLKSEQVTFADDQTNWSSSGYVSARIQSNRRKQSILLTSNS